MIDSGFDDPDLGPPLCLCFEEKPAICHDTDLGLICGDCAHDLARAIVLLVNTPGIAAHASAQSNR